MNPRNPQEAVESTKKAIQFLRGELEKLEIKLLSEASPLEYELEIGYNVSISAEPNDPPSFLRDKKKLAFFQALITKPIFATRWDPPDSIVETLGESSPVFHMSLSSAVCELVRQILAYQLDCQIEDEMHTPPEEK